MIHWKQRSASFYCTAQFPPSQRSISSNNNWHLLLKTCVRFKHLQSPKQGRDSVLKPPYFFPLQVPAQQPNLTTPQYPSQQPKQSSWLQNSPKQGLRGMWSQVADSPPPCTCILWGVAADRLDECWGDELSCQKILQAPTRTETMKQKCLKDEGDQVFVSNAQTY